MNQVGYFVAKHFNVRDVVKCFFGEDGINFHSTNIFYFCAFTPVC